MSLLHLLNCPYVCCYKSFFLNKNFKILRKKMVECLNICLFSKLTKEFFKKQKTSHC